MQNSTDVVSLATREAHWNLRLSKPYHAMSLCETFCMFCNSVNSVDLGKDIAPLR